MEEYRLRLFENRGLFEHNRGAATRGWRKLHIKKLQTPYTSWNNIKGGQDGPGT
jgi:hypothetical protein